MRGVFLFIAGLFFIGDASAVAGLMLLLAAVF